MIAAIPSGVQRWPVCLRAGISSPRAAGSRGRAGERRAWRRSRLVAAGLAVFRYARRCVQYHAGETRRDGTYREFDLTAAPTFYATVRRPEVEATRCLRQRMARVR